MTEKEYVQAKDIATLEILLNVLNELRLSYPFFYPFRNEIQRSLLELYDIPVDTDNV